MLGINSLFKKVTTPPVQPLSISITLVGDDLFGLEQLSTTMIGLSGPEKFYVRVTRSIESWQPNEMPDIIVLDFEDPLIEVRRTVQAVRYRLGKSRMPSIVVLLDNIDDEIAARQNGADDIIAKHQTADAIIEHLRAIGRQRHLPATTA